MKGFKDSNNKFHPISNNKKGTRKSRDQSTKSTGVKIESRIRKKSAIAEETNFDMAIDRLKKSLLEGLNENQWSPDLQRLKNVTWDVDVTYSGSHGTSDSEYFTITAFYKGVGSVEYQEAFSNDDWFDTSDKKLTKRIETDSDFAEKEYDEWLIGLLDLYEDSMFEGLIATIEATYRE
ncbi:MAG: hypothetical protein KJI69_03760 [Patescibacteria group bacterium]|nr:hypothetical protein [Patescibacteria group bacterium]